MNRRQFLGASIAAFVAALSLPFERFAEWCRALLGAAPLKELASLADAYEFRMGSYANLMLGMPMHIHFGEDEPAGYGTITAIDREHGTITVSA